MRLTAIRIDGNTRPGFPGAGFCFSELVKPATVAIAAGLALGVASALWFWRFAAQGPSDLASAGPVAPGASSAAAQVEVRTAASGSLPGATTVDQSANELQQSLDLRAVFERFRDSTHPRERNLAYRAWSACFPAFMTAKGGMMSISELSTNGQEQDAAAARRAQALRDLWSRCKGFGDMPNAQLQAEGQRQRDAWMTGLAHSPGDSAAQAHMQGDSKEGLRIARSVIATRDPYAIESLKDFVVHYWWDWNDRHPDQPVQRPDLRALAFGVAACRFGLDCGPASLTALQHCASAGACTGDAVDRYMQTLPSQADRDALLLMSQQVERAILQQDFQALGLPGP